MILINKHLYIEATGSDKILKEFTDWIFSKYYVLFESDAKPIDSHGNKYKYFKVADRKSLSTTLW